MTKITREHLFTISKAHLAPRQRGTIARQTILAQGAIGTLLDHDIGKRVYRVYCGDDEVVQVESNTQRNVRLTQRK